MHQGKFIMSGLALLGLPLIAAATPAPRQPPVVRMAELSIVPGDLPAYKAALAEEIESSVRLEPGVLALNAVTLNDNPAHIRILEVYASKAAYEAHVKTPHFLKYKNGTATMVVALNLLPAEPVLLCSKGSLSESSASICLK